MYNNNIIILYIYIDIVTKNLLLIKRFDSFMSVFGTTVQCVRHMCTVHYMHSTVYSSSYCVCCMICGWQEYDLKKIFKFKISDF